MEALGIYDVEDIIDPDMLEAYTQMMMLQPSKEATVSSEAGGADFGLALGSQYGTGPSSGGAAQMQLLQGVAS